MVLLFLRLPSKSRFSALSSAGTSCTIQFPYGPSAEDDLTLHFVKVELLDAICQTKATTPGEDRIPASFFKGLDHSLDLLLEVYNSILFSGDIPPSWTPAGILPITKLGNKAS